MSECSEACLAGVGKDEDADSKYWHHLECPNHNLLCCPGKSTVPEDYMSDGPWTVAS